MSSLRWYERAMIRIGAQWNVPWLLRLALRLALRRIWRTNGLPKSWHKAIRERLPIVSGFHPTRRP